MLQYTAVPAGVRVKSLSSDTDPTDRAGRASPKLDLFEAQQWFLCIARTCISYSSTEITGAFESSHIATVYSQPQYKLDITCADLSKNILW